MVVLFESISARRRGRGHKSSLPAYTGEDDGSSAISDRHEHEHKKSKSLFYIYSQTTSCKSILMIAAALMLMTFPLVQKSNLNLRYESQSDGSIIQTHLREAEAIKTDGSRKATTVAAPAPTTNEEKLHDAEIVDSKIEELQHPPTLKYTAELAARAVQPTVWTCGEKDRKAQAALDPITNQRPFFAFVHVYKTAGSTVRDFFREYAAICNKSLALVFACRGSSVKQCQLQAKVNAPHSHKGVSSAILHDHYDILGGHLSFGMADDIFSNATDTTAAHVRHMVFLRQPMARFVSHILYQQKQRNKNQRDTIEETAEDIKKRVRRYRGKGEYVSSIYKYLLTPTQRAMTYDQEQTKEEVVAHKAQLAIDNLLRYNAIVGMTETFSQSMQLFEHAMGHTSTSTRKEEEAQEMFSRYIGEEVSRNKSKRKSISTGSVLTELNKDDEFMAIFREFVKYEQKIFDFALVMHEKQYEAVQAKSLH